MDTDSGINDKRLKLDSIADSSPGEQAHFFTQSYTNGISYKSNIFVSKSVRHFSSLNLVRKFVLFCAMQKPNENQRFRLLEILKDS